MLEFILDNKETEDFYLHILNEIKRSKNGLAVDAMKKKGLVYKTSWGVSIAQLREIASKYKKNHLLALKLWNKGWRESMILATMLDEPDKIDERQMDFWIKSATTFELVDQAIFNLYAYSKFAFVKAMEYCCGKTLLINYAGIQLIGRLARVDENAIDEMFEVFFSKLIPLAKDPRLQQPLYNAIISLSKRNQDMKQLCISFLNELSKEDEQQAKHISKYILDDIKFC